jgi:hypothetical protein
MCVLSQVSVVVFGLGLNYFAPKAMLAVELALPNRNVNGTVDYDMDKKTAACV